MLHTALRDGLLNANAERNSPVVMRKEIAHL